MSRYYSSDVSRMAHPKRQADELPVQRGLAVTPAQMLVMAQEGIPISSQGAEYMYDDGQRTVDFVPPLERQRRVEIGDLWENQMDIRKKARKLYQMQQEQKGDE